MNGAIKGILLRIRSISLRWKLLIPFLFFAFAGTTILVYIGLRSQQQMIRKQEQLALIHQYQHFMEEINSRMINARMLAVMISGDKVVQRLFFEQRREELLNFLMPVFEILKRDFEVSIFQFYTPPARLFLSLNRPERWGDNVGNLRRTILVSYKRKEPVSGLERGIMGIGIMGIAPVFYFGKFVGTVEIGYSLGKGILNYLHRRWGYDLTLYEMREGNKFAHVSKTGPYFRALLKSQMIEIIKRGEKILLIGPDEFPNRSILYCPVKDYSGKDIAVIEISSDRTEIMNKMKRTKDIMILIGVCGIVISFSLTFIVTYLFLKPIHRIIEEADQIAEGKREKHLEYPYDDEIGILTRALNRMLDALNERRKKIQEYARNLERRVAERTADLVATMENYRNLVENIPLIVYRVHQDGTTEFVNSYLTEALGYSIEEAVGDRNFWKEKICGGDEGFQVLIDICFKKGEELRSERKIRHKNGGELDFIDHAIPSVDVSGRTRWVDGTMMDISELKRLQDKALRAEEIRIISEISSRVAHEMRNPLVSAGGFARRLKEKLPPDDPNHRLASLIVNEVARMEKFLNVLFSSIRCDELETEPVQLKDIIEKAVEGVKYDIEKRGIEFIKDFEDLPLIMADKERLTHAFESIIKHSIISMPEGEKIYITGALSNGGNIIRIVHKIKNISEEDLSQFFYPHIEPDPEKTVADLPLARIVIHRHGAGIFVSKDDEDRIVLEFEFPLYGICETGQVKWEI